MEGGIMQYPPGDSRMIDKIVHQLKSQGIFDQFRKECIADVDTKPAYQNLHQRVEGSVTGFLASQVWRPDLNKNQLRDSLRKHIHESGFLDIGVERIVDQVVNPKIMSVFMPQVEDVVYKYLGIEKPKKGKENQHVYVATLTQENLARREERKLSTLTDLLPKELEPISPESDTLKEKEDNSVDDGEVGFPDDKEDSSPPFEPIDVSSHLEESSMDSHLSGISELTSHDSQHSHVSFIASNPTNNSSSAKLALDLSNNDSQLSKVSSGSHLSIVSLGEQNCKLLQNIETNEESQQSSTSFHFPVEDTEISGSDVIRNKENDFVKDVNFLISRESYSEESTSDSKIHTHVYSDYKSLSDSPLFNKELEKDQEETLDEGSGDILKKNSFNKYAKICSIKFEMKTEIIGDKAAETDNKRLIDKFQTKHCDENVEKVNVIVGEQHERKLQDISDSKGCGKLDKLIDDRYDRKLNEKLEQNLDEKSERKYGEKFELNFSEKLETKYHEKMERRGDNNIEEKLVRSYFETYEKNAEEKLELEMEEKLKREKIEKKIVEKFENKLDSKYEKRLYDKSDKKTSHIFDMKLDFNLEKNLEERDSKKFDDKADKKISEKSSKKVDDKYSKKIDVSYEKKSKEKYERRPDEKLEKKANDKIDKKYDNRSEKKLEDKQEKTQDKCKEEKDKLRERKSEKKRLNSENKDTKKSDSSSHSSDSDRKKCDKHKKDRGDNWSKLDKSNKLDGRDEKERIEKDSKEKYKHEEKERDILKEKSKFETKESRDERRNEDKEKKGEKDSHKEKLKKDEVDSTKHEKDSKKSDEKKERNGKEKPKSDDKGRLRYDDKYKEKIRTESKDKSDREKNSKYDEKNSKDGNRSNNKESKDKSKQDMKDKGKDGANRNDEKKNKEKSKHEDKSSTLSEKGGKKIDKKKKDSDYSKSARTDHKTRNNGKKSKEQKEKNVSDDHRLYRDKWSDDRRSTDRDSNGAAHDKSIGNTTSRTSSSETQQTQSRHDKSDGTSSGSNKSDSSGNSESSETNAQLIESSKDTVDQASLVPKSASPSSSLPFKKRPLSIQSDDEQPSDEQSSPIRLAKLFNNKIKKPKIAANIFEVKKIMMLRKSLARKERKQQKELFKSGNGKVGEKEIKSIMKPSNPVLAKRKKLHNIEKSLHKEANTSLLNRQMPETDSEDDYVPDLKYFESELASSTLSHTDSDFLAYVKQLVENDNISEISTPSDTASEASDIDDIIHLSNINFDDTVAAELGAKILKTDSGTEIVFDMLPENKTRKSLSAIELGEFESLPLLEKISVVEEPLQQPIVLINPCDSMLKCNMMERINSRPSSVLSNWSDRSVDDIVLDHTNMKRNLRSRSASVTSSNSNKSLSDKIEMIPNDVSAGKGKETTPKPKRKRVFSRKKSRKETGLILKLNSPVNTAENIGLRRSRKSNARYSNEMFVSSCNADGNFVETDDVNYDAFSEERDRILLDESPQQEYPAITPNNATHSSSGVSKICFMSVNIPATITEAEDDSSDKELISEPSAGDGYDIMKDNNNVDKGSSEDERGCGDGLLLNQDLILPTLRDLMVESGFRKEDDKSDILPSLKTGDTPAVTSLLVSGSNVSTSFSQNIRGVYKETEKKRPRLGRSRRVGLGRPPPKEISHQGGEDINVSRTMIPPSSNMADFVMPLSPESDVSASSGEVKKTVTDSKVGESQVNSSSNFDEKTISNNQFGDTEIRRSLRSGVGTTSLRGQRYNSDDLYKPRPLFTPSSRRVRGQELTLIQESMTNCTAKRHTSDVSEVTPVSIKRRR